MAPAAQAALSAQQAAPPPTPPPARPAGFQAQQNIPKLKTTELDMTSEPVLRFFTPAQFAALQRLGAIMMPPLKGNPGALDAHAPEFLDFLIGASPADRQKLYRDGLDHLDTLAKQKFSSTFAKLDDKQADAVLKPLMVVRYWPQDRPKDKYQDFAAQVHDDLRTATQNSREWAEASAKSGRSFNRGGNSRGFYWAPIDPVVGD